MRIALGRMRLHPGDAPAAKGGCAVIPHLPEALLWIKRALPIPWCPLEGAREDLDRDFRESWLWRWHFLQKGSEKRMQEKQTNKKKGGVAILLTQSTSAVINKPHLPVPCSRFPLALSQFARLHTAATHRTADIPPKIMSVPALHLSTKPWDLLQPSQGDNDFSSEPQESWLPTAATLLPKDSKENSTGHQNHSASPWHIKHTPAKPSLGSASQKNHKSRHLQMKICPLDCLWASQLSTGFMHPAAFSAKRKNAENAPWKLLSVARGKIHVQLSAKACLNTKVPSG